MVQNKNSTGFFVQIIKLVKYTCFHSTRDMDGTYTTMLDADNIAGLRPKPYVSKFIAAKKEIVMEKEKFQKQKRPKRKIIQVLSNSKNIVSKEPFAPTQFLSKKIPAKKRTKTTIHLKKTTVISDLTTTSSISDNDKIYLLQFFKPSVIPTPKHPTSQLTAPNIAGGSGSYVLIAYRPRGGVVFYDPLPETTRSSFSHPVSTDKSKSKMRSPEEPVEIGSKSSIDQLKLPYICRLKNSSDFYKMITPMSMNG